MLIDEGIKSARRTHNVLVGVFLAAAAVFLFPPEDTSTPYRNAEKELEAIRSLHDALENQWVSEFGESYNEAWADEIDTINGELAERGFGVSDIIVSPIADIPYELEELPFHGTVGEIAEWLMNPPGAITVLAPPTDVGQLVEGISPEPLWDWSIVAIDSKESGSPRIRLQVNDQIDIRRDAIEPRLVRPFGYVFNQHAWATANGHFSELKTENGEWLPSVRAVWEQVEGLTLRSAERHLREQAVANEREVLLGPIQLNSRWLVWVVPRAMAVLLLILIGHLNFISERRKAFPDECPTAAWMCLYPTVWGFMYSLASIVIAPFWITYAMCGNKPIDALGIVAGPGLIAFGYVMALHYRLGNSIFGSGFGETDSEALNDTKPTVAAINNATVRPAARPQATAAQQVP